MRWQDKRVLLAASIVGGLSSMGARAQTLPFNVVVASGMTAPDGESNPPFSDVDVSYSIRGDIIGAFAKTNPGTSSGDWLYSKDTLTLAVRNGQFPVNLPGQSVMNPTNIELDSSGDIAFYGAPGICVLKNGVLTFIATNTSLIPGSSSLTFGGIGRPVMNESADVAFYSDAGIFTNAFGNGLQRLAYAGQKTPDGGTYTSFDSGVRIGGDRITATGQATVFGIACRGIYAFTPSGSQIIAQLNDPAPLFPGYLYDGFNTVYTNLSGQVSFQARMLSAGPQHIAFDAVLSENSSGLFTVARTGQAVAGVPGATYTTLGDPVSSNNGRVLFRGGFHNLTDVALFATDTNNAVHLVAQRGEAAPDFPAGVTLAGDYQFYAIGDTGTVGFIDTLHDPSGVFENTRALFAADTTGRLHSIVYEGETIPAGPGLPNWTIQEIQFQSTFWDPLPDTSISGDRLLYRLTFSGNRSGLYTTVVPESDNPYMGTGGSWNTPGSWNYGMPNGAGAIAVLQNQAAETTISLDGDKTLGTLIIDCPLSFTINPGTGGALNFANEGNSTSLQVRQGQHKLAVPLKFNDTGYIDVADGAKISTTAGIWVASGRTLNKTGNGTIEITSGIFHAPGAGTVVAAGELRVDQISGNGSLRIQSGATARLTAAGLASSVNALSIEGGIGAWAGTLDIGQSGLVINYPTGASPLQTIVDQIKSAKTSGWTGPGIGSTAAAADPTTAVAVAEASVLLALTPGQTATFMGQQVDANSLLVRFTKMGDANMDGQVNFADLVAVAQHYGAPAADGWVNGDFNYDGQVNFADLVAVAQNYGSMLAFSTPPTPSESSVPEPAALPLAGLISTQLLRRRRKSKGLLTA